MTESSYPIRILHVDDNREFARLTATCLENESDRFEVTVSTSPTEALDCLDSEAFDCIVSDYDMPELNGVEFLETVGERYPDLPFILFTGKGSEEIASDAISAGVSDYLQKKGGTDQYTILSNRISNLVEKYRAETRLEQYDRERADARAYRQQLLEIISDGEIPDEEKTDRLLELGCDRFAVENGHLVLIDNDVGVHEVISVCGSDIVREGVSDLSETYCRKTIETDEILDIYDVNAQDWENDPAYEQFDIQCYIGGKLFSDGNLKGTLCFVDSKPRDPLSHDEKAFFDLLIRWVGHLTPGLRKQGVLEQYSNDQRS